MACGLDPLHLAQGVPGAVPVNLYALVGYIPAPLGEFLDGLRAQLVPDCRLRSHVSLLPPRPLTGASDAAWQQIRRMAEHNPFFHVQLGNIEVFEDTSVIYVSLNSGSSELRHIHALLNHDSLGFDEPFAYHPHITLAQKFPPGDLPRLREIAVSAWAGYAGLRGFDVDMITFVQNSLLTGIEANGAPCNTWIDLAECRMAR